MSGTRQRTMTAWCWVVILFGFVLMGAAFGPTDGPSRFLFSLLGGGVPPFDAPLRFSVGLMGAVTFGWGLTLLAVTSISRLLSADIARSLWRRVTAAVAIWYLVDSAISIATGFGLNAVSNTVLLVAFATIIVESGVIAPRQSAHNRGFSAG